MSESGNLCVEFHRHDALGLTVLNTVRTVFVWQRPFTLDAPCTKACVSRVIASEVTMFDETKFIVTAVVGDAFVLTHDYDFV